MSDLSNEELPEGWAKATLKDVATTRLGKMLDAAKQKNGRQLPYLRNVNVRWGSFDLSDLLTMAFAVGEFDEFSLRSGDVLICEGGEPGRSAVWRETTTDLKFQKALHRVRLGPGICPEWLAFQLRLDALSDQLEEYFTGSTIKHFTGVSLARYRFPIPPSAEQRRIVAAVEQVLEKVAAAHEKLERVLNTLRWFRQAVLAAACSGRLTVDWRELNQNEETPVLPAFDRTSGADAVPELPEYPEHWCLTSVGACSELVQYGTSDRSDPSGVVPLLRMGNIQEGRVVFDDLKMVGEKLPGLSNLLLEHGDLLFNRTNSPELVGKSGVFESDERMTFASYLIRVRCKSGSVDSRLLCWWLNSPWGREWAAKVRTDGVSQSNINGTKLKQMPVLVPPLTEQNEIIRRGAALLALADAIEQNANSALGRVKLLTQTVLTKAFRGELVPTEAELARREGRSYEPASELLARLKVSVNGEAKRSRAKKTSKRSSTSGEGLLEFMEG